MFNMFRGASVVEAPSRRSSASSQSSFLDENGESVRTPASPSDSSASGADLITPSHRADPSLSHLQFLEMGISHPSSPSSGRDGQERELSRIPSPVIFSALDQPLSPIVSEPSCSPQVQQDANRSYVIEYPESLVAPSTPVRPRDANPRNAQYKHNSQYRQYLLPPAAPVKLISAAPVNVHPEKPVAEIDADADAKRRANVRRALFYNNY